MQIFHYSHDGKVDIQFSSVVHPNLPVDKRSLVYVQTKTSAKEGFCLSEKDVSSSLYIQLE